MEAEIERRVRRQRLVLGVISVAAAGLGCLFVLPGVCASLGSGRTGNSFMLIMGGAVFFTLLATAVASLALGERPWARNLGMISASIAVLCLFYDAILLISDAKQLLGLGHGFVFLAILHGLYLFVVTARTRLL